MKKAVVYILALCAVTLSCSKSVKAPLSYTVESGQNAPLGDTYIPDHGNYTMPVLIKYLTGHSEEKVTVSIKGLPADVQVVEDTFSQIPTFRADFMFVTTNAAHGTYPVTITASATGSLPQTHTFNLIVRSADCASNLWGNFTTANECTGRNFSYTTTGVATGVTDQLDIINLGGFGTNTTTRAVLNCNKDSLFISSQNIGNGIIMQGAGTFTGNSMDIYYTATNVASSTTETCIAHLTK
jgi:hypothetical protein